MFASALSGNKRADLVGEHTIGRAAAQKLIKLPDGAGLWLSTCAISRRAGSRCTKKGWSRLSWSTNPTSNSAPPPPAADPVLDKAIEQLSEKKAA